MWIFLNVIETLLKRSEQEMLRQRLEELAKSFKKRATPSEEDQQIETGSEIDTQVMKILRLISNEDRDERVGFPTGSSQRELELIKLIQDLHKQYQMLYAQNICLQEKLKDDFQNRLEDGHPSSAHSSDSEYFSSEELDSHNGQLEYEHLKATDSNKWNAEIAYTEAANQKHKLVSLIEEKDAFPSTLREVASEGELLNLPNVQEFEEFQPPSQIKRLRRNITTLQSEVELLRRQKLDLEARMESKDIVARKLQEENIGLRIRISELRLASKQKEDEMSALQKKSEDNEKKMTSKFAELMRQVSSLQLEVESLNFQKNELEGRMVHENTEAMSRIKGLMEQDTSRNRELESLQNEKTRLDAQLERNNKENVQIFIQIENLKDELARKTIAEERTLEENARYTLLIQDLEPEVNSLRKWKHELERQMQNKINEIDQLKGEKEELHHKVITLERKLTEKKCQASDHNSLAKNKEQEDSAEIVAGMSQVKNPQNKMNSPQALKNQLEVQNTELKRHKTDPQRVLKREERPVDRSRDGYRQTVIWSPRSNINWSPRTVERKMEELAEEFHKKMEDNIRILYQRILVAEQLHMENKDGYKKMKDQIKQDSQALEVKLAKYEAELTKLKDMSETANDVLSGLDLVASKFEDSENFMNRIAEIVKEIQVAKEWVKNSNEEIKRLKNDRNRHPHRDENELFLLREKIRNLEGKSNTEQGGKQHLRIRVRELEEIIRQKNDQLLDLAEEKREAIRQLCLLIDYHQGRYNHLRKAILSNLYD